MNAVQEVKYERLLEILNSTNDLDEAVNHLPKRCFIN